MSVDLTDQQARAIKEWAGRTGVIEAVRLYGSRAKGCARPDSDVDLAITASDGNYVRFADEWERELSDKLDAGTQSAPPPPAPPPAPSPAPPALPPQTATSAPTSTVATTPGDAPEAVAPSSGTDPVEEAAREPSNPSAETGG